MDYKDKYNKLVEAVKVLQKINPSDEGIQNWVNDNVPEFRESEDEKIRNTIISCLKGNMPDNDYLKECIAWLEKLKVFTEHGDGLYYFANSEFTYVDNPTWDNGSFLEKQDGQKETICDKCKKDQPSHSCQDITSLGRCYMEGEQKPINDTDEDIVEAVKDTSILDMAEPKFKVGDWITNGNYTWKIVEVKPLDYILQSQDGNVVDDTISHVDEQFHSFAIEDAKDGDVLYSLDSNRPFIYKERKGYEQARAYCGLNIYGKFFVWATEDCVITLDKYVPATKEQRDTLFAKMKETGYEWDADKKELKKIEQSPIDVRTIGYWHVEDVEQNPAWSEEDDNMFQSCIGAVATNDYYKGEEKEQIYDWLKTLKQRIGG